MTKGVHPNKCFLENNGRRREIGYSVILSRTPSFPQLYLQLCHNQLIKERKQEDSCILVMKTKI